MLKIFSKNPKKINQELYRQDFPLLNKKHHNKPIIYFDNACMSLRPIQVMQKMNEYYENYPACAGRSNHFLAQQVEQEIHQSRSTIAKFFNTSPKAIVFTKNATEALNLVAHSYPFNKDDVVLTSDKEHNSNLIPWLKLQQQGKLKYDYLSTTKTNEFDLNNLKSKLEQYHGKVKLVSIVYTSNLDGVTNPIKEISQLVHKHKAKLMVDATQAALHQEINIKKLNIDYLAISSHKLCGPNGLGILISTEPNLKILDQFLVGGETIQDSTLNSYIPEKIPERFEAGLQNYPGIIGFAEALKYIKKVGIINIHNHLLILNQYATEQLQTIPKLHILGPIEPEKRSSIISFVIEKKNIHEISLLLSNLHNIAVRSGAHCVHSWFNKPENKSSLFKDGTIRISFSFYNTIEEVDVFIKAIKEISRL